MTTITFSLILLYALTYYTKLCTHTKIYRKALRTGIVFMSQLTVQKRYIQKHYIVDDDFNMIDFQGTPNQA